MLSHRVAIGGEPPPRRRRFASLWRPGARRGCPHAYRPGRSVGSRSWAYPLASSPPDQTGTSQSPPIIFPPPPRQDGDALTRSPAQRPECCVELFREAHSSLAHPSVKAIARKTDL